LAAEIDHDSAEDSTSDLDESEVLEKLSAGTENTNPSGNVN
jgi:hypothetical protein